MHSPLVHARQPVIPVLNDHAYRYAKMAPELCDLKEQLTVDYGDGSMSAVFSQPDMDSTLQALNEVPEQATLVLVGGDGLFSQIVNAQLHPKASSALRHARLALVPAGGENDAATMLNQGWSLLDLLSKGEVVDFHPMEWSFTPEEADAPEETGFFTYSAGIGALAVGAAIANGDKYRSWRRWGALGKPLSITSLVTQTLRRAKPFKTDKGELFDVTVSAGERMGGMPWFRPKQRKEGLGLLAPNFLVSYTKPTWPSKTANGLSRLFAHGMGEMCGEDDVVEVVLREAVGVEFDGETRRFGAGTLHMSRSKESVEVVAAPA